MNPLTRSEVESWPALGPMNLDKQRVLDLITTNADLLVRLDTQASLRLTAEAERDDLRAANARLTAEWNDAKANLNEARQSEGALRGRLTELEAELDELRALNAQLAAQVDEARRQRDECAAALQKTTRACECSPESGCTDAQARAVMHAMASEVADSVVDAVSRAANAAVTANTAHVAVSVGARADRLRFFGSVDEAVELVDALRSDARVSAAISQRHEPSEHVAVTVERAADDLCLPFPLVIRLSDRHELAVTTDEAVALIAALLADGAVHSAWLHGRGGR